MTRKVVELRDRGGLYSVDVGLLIWDCALTRHRQREMRPEWCCDPWLMPRRNVRVCLAASAGGHASELVKLESSWAGCDCFFVTTSHVVERQLAKFGRVYVVNESNRKQPLRVLKALASCLRIVAVQRPDVVISTGASVGCLMAIFGRLSVARVVWVDGIANAEHLSSRHASSGRLPISS